MKTTARIEIPGRWAIFALALLLHAGATRAQDHRILRHESFDAALIPHPPSTALEPRPGERGSDASFDAYGRRFDLRLESNARVLGLLNAAQQGRVEDVELLRGKIDGIDGSWIRLTRYGDLVSGALWDGSDLYAIESRSNVEAHLLSPDDGGEIVIYRLADTIGNRSDIVIAPHAGDDGSSLQATALTGMLASLVVPGRQLELGVVADEQYSLLVSTPADQRLIATINVIDGIFFWQLGVEVVIGEMQILAGPNPLASADPVTLLDQFGLFKSVSPSLAAMDLAHLFTGRDLVEPAEVTGEIFGVANLGAVCDARFGVALTQATLGVLDSALVATHEIAHNLGAPHDGEEGSPCVDAPPKLMSPILNFSDEFSQCSIDEMTARLQSAACLAPVPLDDARLTVTGLPDLVNRGERFEMRVVVDSTGPEDALGLEVTIDTLRTEIQHVSGRSWDCEEAQTTAVCRLLLLPAGGSASFEVAMAATQFNPAEIDVTLRAFNDSDTSNNNVFHSIDVIPNIVMVPTLEPAEIFMQNGETRTLVATIENRGTAAAPTIEISGHADSLADIVSAVPESGTCSVPRPSDLDCVLDELPAGASTTIELEIRGDFVSSPIPTTNAWAIGNVAYLARAMFAGEIAHEENVITRVTIAERTVDLVTSVTGPTDLDKGESGIFTASLENLGPDTARRARLVFDFEDDDDLHITSFSSSIGNCDLLFRSIWCEVDTLMPGESMVLTAEGTALTPGNITLATDGTSREWELDHDNDSASMALKIVNTAPPRAFKTEITLSDRHLLEFGDVNGNGHTDVGLLLKDIDAWNDKVFIFDGRSDRLLEQVPFGVGAEGFAMVPDVTGDGIAEPAVLLFDQAKVKDHVDDTLLGRPPFDSAYDWFSLLSLGDVDGNSIPDIAAVGQHPDTRRTLAQVRNATTGQLVSRVLFDPDFHPLGAVVLDDIGDSPAKEIAVLGVGEGRVYRVQVKDSFTGNIISRVYFDRRFNMQEFAALPDENGRLTYLAVLGRNDNRIERAQIKRAIDGSLVSLIRFQDGYEPRAVVGFADSNGSGGGEIAVLSESIGEDRVIVQVKEIEDGTPVREIPFDTRFEPITAIGVNGVGGTGRNEIAVFGHIQPYTMHLQIKDLLTGDPVNNILMP